jgi:hypothetical protein
MESSHAGGLTASGRMNVGGMDLSKRENPPQQDPPLPGEPIQNDSGPAIIDRSAEDKKRPIVERETRFRIRRSDKGWFLLLSPNRSVIQRYAFFACRPLMSWLSDSRLCVLPFCVMFPGRGRRCIDCTAELLVAGVRSVWNLESFFGGFHRAVTIVFKGRGREKSHF